MPSQAQVKKTNSQVLSQNYIRVSFTLNGNNTEACDEKNKEVVLFQYSFDTKQ